MNFNNLKIWVSNHIPVNNRIINVAVWYILFLMVTTRKHTLEEAAIFSKLNKSQFSRFLEKHSKSAIYTLEDLSKKQARQFSKTMEYLSRNNLIWKIAIVIDSTLQSRASLHPENAKRFNHGKGFVIGHQWTNIIIIINDKIIPLPPIPYFSKRYCRQKGLRYKTEHDLVVEYIEKMKIEDYIGSYDSEDVVVLADSGYDDRNIEIAIARRNWKFIIAISKTRSVKSEKKYHDTPKSKNWSQIAEFFKNHRQKWETVRLFTNGAKRKRMDFRIRQIIGYLRHVGKVQLICSEYRKRPDGRRKYLACNDLKATARQILMGYRIRWFIEIFHKEIKSYLGFEDVATKCFDSVQSHVHWVYCAYILLNFYPPGIPAHIRTVAEKQRIIKEIIKTKEISRIRQMITQIGGVDKFKYELQSALQPV